MQGFLSRKKHKLTGHQDLRAALAKEVNAETAILDGELVVLNHLLSLNGMDLRKVPLLARKDKLKRILSSRSPHILYVDHSRGNGTALYRLACQLDLEIVAKRADSRYEGNPHVWSRPRSRILPTVKRKARRLVQGSGITMLGPLKTLRPAVAAGSTSRSNAEES